MATPAHSPETDNVFEKAYSVSTYIYIYMYMYISTTIYCLKYVVDVDKETRIRKFNF